MNFTRLYRFFREAGSPITIREAWRIRRFNGLMRFIEDDPIENWMRRRRELRRKK